MSPRPKHQWPEEREAALRLMWPDRDYSAADIAREMGVSRNAVIGKARRLKLVPRGNPGTEAVLRMRAANARGPLR